MQADHFADCSVSPATSLTLMALALQVALVPQDSFKDFEMWVVIRRRGTRLILFCLKQRHVLCM